MTNEPIPLSLRFSEALRGDAGSEGWCGPEQRQLEPRLRIGAKSIICSERPHLAAAAGQVIPELTQESVGYQRGAYSLESTPGQDMLTGAETFWEAEASRSVHHPSATVYPDSPAIIEVPVWLKAKLPAIQKALSGIDGDFSSPVVQEQVRECLMMLPAWSRWIAGNSLAAAPRPTLLKAGLETEKDDELARRMLVGIALCFQPKSYVPPYAIGNQAVTEVQAQPNSTRESHSQNDLPAPPHTAGFFEDVPPHTCYFSCIRPHSGGGAETTVLNLKKILAQALQAVIDEWSNRTYYLKTPKRMGEEIKPFQLLRWIDNVPFLRYRKEYTVGFDQDPSLKLLEELVTNPANQFLVALQSGETLIHWNGAPHSRLIQHGATPEATDERRKLIRCRTRPLGTWEKNFRRDF